MEEDNENSKLLGASGVDPLIWKSLKVPSESKLNTNQAKTLLKKCSLLKELNLKLREGHDAASLAIIALEHCPRLESLTLKGNKANAKSVLLAVRMHGLALRKLHLYGTDYMGGILSETYASMANLTTINLHCDSIRDRDLRAIADCCCRLEEFSCSSCEALTMDAMFDFLQAVVATIKKLDVGITAHAGERQTLSRCYLQRVISVGLEYGVAAKRHLLLRKPCLTSISVCNCCNTCHDIRQQALQKETTMPFLNGRSQKCVNVEDLFSHLPDELIVKILSYLDLSDLACRASLVNQRFQYLCLDASLWMNLRLPLEDKLSDEQAEQLLLRCTLLKSFNLEKRGPDSAATLAIFALQQCRKLKSLSLSSCMETKLVLEAIEMHGNSMRDLCLNGNSLEDGMLAETPGCLVHLTGITLTYVDGIGEKDLTAIADYCHGLEHFVCNVGTLSEDVMSYFLQAASATLSFLVVVVSVHMPLGLLNIIDKCQMLKTLVVVADSLSPEELGAISRLAKLEFLEIEIMGHCWLGKIGFMSSFSGQKLMQLKDLSLSWHSPETCPVDDDVLERVACNYPNLRKLWLKGCSKVTNAGVKKILDRCQLQQLVFENVQELTEEIFPEAPPPKLKKLLVRNCPNIREGVAVQANIRWELHRSLHNFVGVDQHLDIDERNWEKEASEEAAVREVLLSCIAAITADNVLMVQGPKDKHVEENTEPLKCLDMAWKAFTCCWSFWF